MIDKYEVFPNYEYFRTVPLSIALSVRRDYTGQFLITKILTIAVAAGIKTDELELG
jgi:hypothetical protein